MVLDLQFIEQGIFYKLVILEEFGDSIFLHLFEC